MHIIRLAADQERRIDMANAIGDMYEHEVGLDFNDVLLMPQYSALSSRDDVDLSSFFTELRLDVPILSAPMDTITSPKMAAFMSKHGGLGVLHRYMSNADLCACIRQLKQESSQVGVAIDTNRRNSGKDLKNIIACRPDLLVMDVAHGDSQRVLRTIEYIKSITDIPVTSGNIATRAAAVRSMNAGADILKVGIGSGAACTTRTVTGVGVPQLTAIDDVYTLAGEHVGITTPIIADGGIKNSGDIVKAIAAGASVVMIGTLFGGYQETYAPGAVRGMASKAARTENGKEFKVAEGTYLNVRIEEDSHAHFTELMEGVKAGFAYLGARNIHELRNKAEWIKLDSATKSYLTTEGR